MRPGVNSEVRDCVLGMVAGIRGEKRAGLEKQARNLARLLARVGPSLTGATARDLKFLRRRGFTGFTPQKVQALRSRGMLPSVEQELAGFNRGTENMFRFVPKMQASGNPYNIDTSVPIKRITRTNAPDAAYQYRSDLRGRSTTIPDTSAPGILADREMRAAIARHEAREWVRGNAALAKGRNLALPGHSGDLTDLFVSPEVGSSHMPGVIYDERVFRSGLGNRLGLGTDWDKMPIVFRDGKPLYRAPRDAYVGGKPLRYEFDQVNQWNKLRDSQLRMAQRLGINGSIDLSDPAVKVIWDRVGAAAYRKYRSLIPANIARELENLNRARELDLGRYRLATLPREIDDIKNMRGSWRFASPQRRQLRLQKAEAELARVTANPPRPLTRREQFLLRTQSRLEPYEWNQEDLTRLINNGHMRDGKYRGLTIPFQERLAPYSEFGRFYGLGRLARDTGIPKRELRDILTRQHVYAPPGSELYRLRRMSPLPRTQAEL